MSRKKRLLPIEIKHTLPNWGLVDYRKYCSAQDLAAFEKVCSAKGKSGKGDGTPVGDGFLAQPENMKFGVRVSSGNIGE